MKSPQDMRIIQIDITNACIHRCSNCTRFCGHHKQPFFMDWETFQKAVASMEGYKGTVGIMGGEPTIHPEFERFVSYIRDNPYFPKTKSLLYKPTKKFMDMVGRMEQRDTYVSCENGIKRNVVDGWGLWSALSGKYNEYYELIQDTFNMQQLNDHKNIMYHSPIMITRKEMGISDEKWYKMRDNCWAQDVWSATITPKGAFFCEIAGALDMLFNGPGGWPIEKGWWKRQPEEFGEQLKWCEICGICIDTFTRNANDEIDDMSPWYYEQLKKLGSPKLKNEGMANVLKINDDGNIDKSSLTNTKQVRHDSYTDNWFARFSQNNNQLNPSGLTGIMIIDVLSEEERQNFSPDFCGLDDIYIVTADSVTYKYLCEKYSECENIKVLYSEKNVWGTMLNKCMLECNREYYIVLMTPNTKLANDCGNFLKEYVLNPGVLLLGTNSGEMRDQIGENITAIFSPKAYALKKASFPVIARLKNVKEFINLWDTNKIFDISLDTFTDIGYEIEKDIKYAIYGAGATAEYLYDRFDAKNIIFVSDSDCEKWGNDFHGHSIISPEELLKRRNEFDKIFIASNYVFEIRTDLIKMGFDDEKIVTTVISWL